MSPSRDYAQSLVQWNTSQHDPPSLFRGPPRPELDQRWQALEKCKLFERKSQSFY